MHSALEHTQMCNYLQAQGLFGYFSSLSTGIMSKSKKKKKKINQSTSNYNQQRHKKKQVDAAIFPSFAVWCNEKHWHLNGVPSVSSQGAREHCLVSALSLRERQCSQHIMPVLHAMFVMQSLTHQEKKG